MKWRMAASAGLISVSLIWGCTPPPPPPPAPPVVEEPLRPVFTKGQFEAIRYDMTYGDVSELLGAESTRQESTYDEGKSDYVRPSLTAWHYWENEDGSFIKAGFIDKRLVEKVAENLPE